MKVETKKTLLLVEDEVIIAMGKQKELEKYGYNVLTVTTGEKAVAVIKDKDNIDLILMDIDLGKGIDGTQAAALIIKEKDIPIVFMSSHTEPEVVEKTEKITSYGYVVKSSGITVLDASIKMAFKLFEASSSLKLSEEKFHVAFTTSPDSININDIKGHYLNINEGYTRLTGYTEEDVIGVLSSDIDIWTIPADREKLVKELKESGRVENLESVFRCKDGSLKTALMSAHLIDLNNEPHILSITRDITELKKADKEINQYEHIVSSSSDMMAFLDREFNYNIVNSAYSKAFGLTPEDFIGKKTLDIFGEEYFYNTIKPNADRCLSGEKVSFQNWYDFPEIGRCFIDLNYYPYYNADNKIVGYVINGRDITKQKQIEIESQKKQYLLTKAQEMGNIGTWELDIKHNSVRWTDETYKIFDLAPGTEINNDLFLSYIHPDDRDYYDKKWEEGLNKGAYDIEHRIIVNDKVKLIREKVEFEFDKKGKPVTAIGFTQDITKNKKTEEKLKINELLFRTIFNEAPLGITLTDSLTGQFLEVNPMFAKIVGRTIEEIKHLDWKSITPPDDIQKDLDDMKRMNAGKISGFQMEKRFIHKDGSEIWINMTITKISVEDKTQPRHLSMIEDITVRKLVEAQVKKQLLEKEIILKESHHRIKNNFATIGSLLSLQADSLSNPEAISAIGDAIRRVYSMQVLYEKLLLSDNYQTTSIKDYMNDLIDDIHSLFPENTNIAIKKQFVDFQLDPKQLFPIGLIVNELLTNIMKYAFAGRDSGLIEVTLKENKGEITLIIQDDGNGLPKGFDINKQKGFGLMLVKMLSEQLNGSFSIENHNGTKNTIKFPV